MCPLTNHHPACPFLTLRFISVTFLLGHPLDKSSYVAPRAPALKVKARKDEEGQGGGCSAHTTSLSLVLIYTACECVCECAGRIIK